MSTIVSLKGVREQYGNVISYPQFILNELNERLMEMKKLGVISLVFAGEKNVLNTHVLGKGHVGIVVLAITEKGKVALKIRRTDADRAEMKKEAEMLKIANAVKVGPKLLGFTDNIIMMESVEGKPFQTWVEALGNTDDSRIRLRKVLRDLLEQSWRLDQVGLDHGELSQASGHILVDAREKAYLLDFETASVMRKVSNVTSICHYLFMRGKVANVVNTLLEEIKKEEILEALKAYKKKCVRENFNKILEKCAIQVF
jgi:putative serine/threonine protein kinase